VKKILSIIIISILCAFPNTVFAVNITNLDISETEMDKELQKIGFSTQQIDSLRYETKKDIFKDGTPEKLVSYEKSYLNILEGGQLKPVEPFDGTINPTSLTSSDLSLTIVAIELIDINGLPAVKLHVQYDWLTAPLYRMHDQLAITWSPGWYAHTYSLTHYWQGFGGVTEK
jgi:hypothetical protein